MKGHLMLLADRLLLRRRTIAETIIDQLKNISPIEHTRFIQPTQLSGQPGMWAVHYCHRLKIQALTLHSAC